MKFHYAKLPKMCKMFESIGTGVVFDRNYITEAVYSAAFKRQTHQEIIKDTHVEYCEMGAVCIYCFKTEYSEYSDPHINIENISKIKKAYYDWFVITNHHGMPVLFLDTTDENLENQLEKIDKFIQRSYYNNVDENQKIDGGCDYTRTSTSN